MVKTKTKTITLRNNNLINDILFNSFEIKFPVEISRTKGKKNIQFPSKWNLTDKNKCTGNEDNIAFRTGICNDITVIDFDDQESIDWFNNNVDSFENVKGHRVKTTQGYHLYFKYSKELDELLASFTKKKVCVIKKIDIRSNGNCIFYGDGYNLEHFEKDLGQVPTQFLRRLKKHFEQTQIKPNENVESKSIKLKIDRKECPDDISFILENLNPKRYINFDDWIKVAICLKHSFGDTYKNHWLKWSKNSTIHKEFQFNDTYWDSIKDGPLSVSSIYEMLKNDNFEAFSKLNEKKKSIIDEESKHFLFGDYTLFMEGIQDYNDVVEFLKHTIRYIINKGNICWAVKIQDENNDIRWNVVKNFPTEFLDGFSYIVQNDDGPEEVSAKFSSVALKIKESITKQNVIFAPYSPSSLYNFNQDKNLNLFAGWKIKYDKNFKIDETLLNPILHHVKKVFCKDDESLFEYIINWLASILQNPQNKTCVCPCFISDQQGAGKNLFWDWVGKEIFGTSYQYVSDIETIFSKFNKRFENSLLIACDEISSNGMAYKQNNQLKSIITQEKQSIEPKGMEAYQINDFRNYAMLSNNEHIVKIEASDRRYVIFECDNCYVGNFEYFILLKSTMNDLNVQKTFFHYLVNKDISNFIVKKIPNSDIRKRVMSLSVPNHIKFLEHYSSTLDDTKTLTLSSTELYSYYQIFIKNFEGNFGLQTSRKFSLEITKFLPKEKLHGLIKYTISRQIVVQILIKYFKDDTFDIEYIGDLDVYNPIKCDYYEKLIQDY